MIQGGKCLGLHVGLGPELVLAALRHYDDERKVRGVLSNGVAEADIGLKQSVVAALARAVKENNHRPFLVRIVVCGNVDLVAVRFSLDGDNTVEETCFRFASAGRCRQKKRQHQACGNKPGGQVEARHGQAV